MKLGIMGGTFDPIHLGHLLLGECAGEEFGLDQVLFMPSGNPPHKQHREGGATNEQRAEMVRLAVEGNPLFAVSLREMQSSAFSYSYQTLEAMRQEAPENELYFIIGGDSLVNFHTWRYPERICAACTLLVAVRDHMNDAELDRRIDALRERYHTDIRKLPIGNLDISSHELRERLAAGKSIRYYVPESVRNYIAENRIYESPGSINK